MKEDDGLALTPPGQLGRALGSAADAPVEALLHVVLGSWWLPFLWVAFVSSATRLSSSTRASGGLDSGQFERSTVGRLARRACARPAQ